MKRGRVWERMLTADLSFRYWGYMGRRYYNRDKGTKAILAVFSSCTVASWTLWAQIPLVWQILSALTAILAIIQPILGYSRLIERIAEIHHRWAELRIAFQDLWDNHVWKDPLKADVLLKDIEKRWVSAMNLEYTLPSRKKLISKCHREVLAARGIT